MIDRRDFLKMLGIGAAAVAAPKFIFDMGANLYKMPPAVVDIWQNIVMVHYDGMFRRYYSCKKVNGILVQTLIKSELEKRLLSDSHVLEGNENTIEIHGELGTI